jgi:hypothetical protein
VTRPEKLVLFAIAVIGAVVVASVGVVFLMPHEGPRRRPAPAAEEPAKSRPEPSAPATPKPDPPAPPSAEVVAKTDAASPPPADLGTGMGSIGGIVRFKGVPTPIRMHVSAPNDACGGDRVSPRLRVSDSGGVADAVIYLDRVPRSEAIDDLPQGVLDHVVCDFLPHVQFAPVNQDLVVKSSDSIAHDVIVTYRGTDETILRARLAEPGAEMRRPIPHTGILAARCESGHPWSSGYVFAVDHPFYAVSDDDGRWTLDDVPAGRYRLRFWHEGFDLLGTKTDGEGNVVGYLWSPDVEQEQEVTVATGAHVVVEFELSERR